METRFHSVCQGARSVRIMRQMKSAVADWSGPQLSLPKGAKIAGEAGSLPYKDHATETVLRIIPGKNWSKEIGANLLAATFRVAMNSDRMGLRLEGAEIQFDVGELVSELVIAEPSNFPAAAYQSLLLADCQTVGGYPKIAHVITGSTSHAPRNCSRRMNCASS